MSSILKGNFKTRKTIEARTEDKEDLETRFEKAAMKRLGGSIAFVAKKKVNWDLKD